MHEITGLELVKGKCSETEDEPVRDKQSDDRDVDPISYISKPSTVSTT